MTNKANRAYYVGVTADLARRIHQHRQGQGSAHCRRYNLTKLVLAEQHPKIEDAIRREKALKEWNRQWKIDLITRANPRWDDLYDHLAGL